MAEASGLKSTTGEALKSPIAGSLASGVGTSMYGPVGGGLAAAGVSLLGNLLAGGEYDDAAAKQAAAQERALALQNQVYQETKANAAPWLKAGQEALPEYQRKVSEFNRPTYNYNQEAFDQSKWKSDGYDWLISQATKANDAAMAAKGMALGSGAAKSLQTRASGLASQEMQNSYDRWLKDSMLRQGQADNAYNRDFTFQNQDLLNSQNLSKVGQDAMGMLAGVGMNYGKTAGENMGNIGDAYAASDIAQGKNWTNSTNLMSNALSKYFEDEASKSQKAKGGA